MSVFKNYMLKARIMMIVEIVLIVLSFIIFQVLENIVVGIYYVLYIAGMFLWILLFILTINLYYKAKKKNRG